MELSAFTYTVYIATTPERTWETLTSADMSPLFWSGCAIESDWRPGSPVKLTREGVVRSSGQVLECTPASRLSYSFIRRYLPEYESEGASQVTFEFEPLGAQTQLTLTHSGFPQDSKIRPVVAESWPIILSSLKTLLETGQPLSDIRRSAGQLVATAGGC